MLINPHIKAAFVLFVGLASIAATVDVAKSDEKIPAKPNVLRIRISKKTTYLTSLVRKDGTIDYPAALNARASNGVTPENNAVTLLVQVCSREELGDPVLKQCYKKLGIAATAKKQRRMLTKAEFADHVAGAKHEIYSEKLDKEYLKGLDAPWSRKDLPKLAAWLEYNKQPLDVVETATSAIGKRTRP